MDEDQLRCDLLGGQSEVSLGQEKCCTGRIFLQIFLPLSRSIKSVDGKLLAIFITCYTVEILLSFFWYEV